MKNCRQAVHFMILFLLLFNTAAAQDQPVFSHTDKASPTITLQLSPAATKPPKGQLMLSARIISRLSTTAMQIRLMTDDPNQGEQVKTIAVRANEPMEQSFILAIPASGQLVVQIQALVIDAAGNHYGAVDEYRHGAAPLQGVVSPTRKQRRKDGPGGYIVGYPAD